MGTWTFHGRDGTGSWTNGSSATLRVERFDAQGVVIRRTDTTGTTRGLTAIYSGQLTGNRIEGEVTWIWPGHGPGNSGKWSGKWSATFGVQQTAAPAPASPTSPAVPAPEPVTIVHAKDTHISGIWQRDARTPNLPDYPPMKVLVVEIRKEIVAMNLGQNFLPPNYPFFRGTLAAPTGSHIQMESFTDRGLVEWYDRILDLDDADHFELYGTQKGGWKFARIGDIAPGEVPCDPANPSHISGAEAFARGWLYLRLKEERTAVCWLRIGAEQGNSGAQSFYAQVFQDGLGGVPKDRGRSVLWIQRAAMRGDFLAAQAMAGIFNEGAQMPHSKQRADYWQNRAELLDPSFIHGKIFLPFPNWVTNNAGPCKPSNPDQVNARSAFNQGRVAYEARDIETAQCWFEISAAEGIMRANVYLGLIKMYGYGLQKDPAAAFALMNKAADANDPFAVMYLSEFYRFGIGTKADPAKAQALKQKVLSQMTGGLDAYLHVQGANLTPDEATAAMFRFFGAAADQVNCDSSNSYAVTHPGPGGVATVQNCQQAENWFAGEAAKVPTHPVQLPEEIFPEQWDLVVPQDYRILKAAAKAGLTR